MQDGKAGAASELCPEEKAFQDALDANPDDHTTRLVFADWLDERRDPRAVGYRALAANRIAPVDPRNSGWRLPGFCNRHQRNFHEGEAHQDTIRATLPDDWFALAAVSPDNEIPHSGWFCRMERADAENWVAELFAKLPAARQAELLAAPTAV